MEPHSENDAGYNYYYGTGMYQMFKQRCCATLSDQLITIKDALPLYLLLVKILLDFVNNWVFLPTKGKVSG